MPTVPQRHGQTDRSMDGRVDGRTTYTNSEINWDDGEKLVVMMMNDDHHRHFICQKYKYSTSLILYITPEVTWL